MYMYLLFIIPFDPWQNKINTIFLLEILYTFSMCVCLSISVCVFVYECICVCVCECVCVKRKGEWERILTKALVNEKFSQADWKSFQSKVSAPANFKCKQNQNIFNYPKLVYSGVYRVLLWGNIHRGREKMGRHADLSYFNFKGDVDTPLTRLYL